MSGKLLLIYICNFHVLSYLLLIYICKLHWNRISKGHVVDTEPIDGIVLAFLRRGQVDAAASFLESVALPIGLAARTDTCRKLLYQLSKHSSSPYVIERILYRLPDAGVLVDSRMIQSFYLSLAKSDAADSVARAERVFSTFALQVIYI
jgi:hypothetical protein